MLEKVKIALQYGNTFCGIDHGSMHGELQLYVTLLKHVKNELTVTNTFEETHIDVLSKKLKKHQHATLIMNTNAVLVKQLTSDQTDATKLVYASFPNIAIEDFYFEILSQANTHFVALCRKEVVHKIIETYKAHHIHIINICLGHTILGTIRDYIKQTPFYTSNAKVTITNNYINTIEKSTLEDQTYNLNGLPVSNTQVLATAGAIASLVQQDVTKNNFLQVNQDLLKRHYHKRFNSQFLKIAGLFVFGVLLINFFIFNHYFNTVNDLKEITAFNQAAKTQIVSLKEEVSSKQKMVADLLQSRSSKSAYYANIIVHSLPESILLETLNYQPLIKRLKADNPIELASNSLNISGESNNSEAFSQWIFKIESQDCVETVEIMDYGNTSKNHAAFTLKITLKNDR